MTRHAAQGVRRAMFASALAWPHAEGLNILKRANAGRAQPTTDAETTPLRHPERYRHDIDIAQVADVWRRGTAAQP